MATQSFTELIKECRLTLHRDSTEQLVGYFNRLVGNKGFATRKGAYMIALAGELISRDPSLASKIVCQSSYLELWPIYNLNSCQLLFGGNCISFDRCIKLKEGKLSIEN
ncbi:hypothetical protein V6R21_05740 [Limibacter armeniacum]|uniref:hypothetical protein n=1 Tax=Limibacter armeniacum TaxID=466084 RepID=UPI002FE518CC